MKLSVCLIVKNEEKVLERLLRQVKKFADEIVVVDTGSTDLSKSIARIFTDMVYDFEWCEDFSAARNFSFSKATCPFVMWLDADDVVTDENVEKINHFKSKEMTADVYMCKYLVAFDENENPTFEYYRERILKKTPNLRWEGFVHEAIVLQGKIEYLDIAIEHRKVETSRDVLRNLKIYEKHISKGEKLDARGLFYYARELFYHNHTEKAIETFKKFLKNKDAYLPNIIDAHLTLARCYILKNDLNNAKDILLDSFKISLPNAEICCALGELALKEDDLKASIFWHKAALNCQQDLKSGAFVQREYYDFIPLLQLSCTYYKIGDIKNFALYHEEAKKIKPNDRSIIFNEQFLPK